MTAPIARTRGCCAATLLSALLVAAALLGPTAAPAAEPQIVVVASYGSILQFSTAAVVKNAPHPAVAQQLVNEILSPSAQGVLVEQFSVSPVNPAVPVPPALIVRGAPDPANMDRYVAIKADVI